VKRNRQVIVVKNDGSVECFATAKLASCLARALEGRSYDQRLSNPLTRAVALHLGDWAATTPPTTQYVFDCACAILRQTGLGDVAEDLGHHRRLRAARRQRTRVLQDLQRPRGVSHPWRKLALVATLQQRYGLRHAVARFLAGQVESQIFALNYRLVTKPFITEMVRNEVLAWGLVDEPVFLVEGTGDPVGPAGWDKEN
jgi:hypothetical protein